MDLKNKKHYLYLMLTLFGAATLSIILFFIIYRIEGLGKVVSNIISILNPIIYGLAIAYLLKPMCNILEQKIYIMLPEKNRKLANPLAVTFSIIIGLAIVALLLLIIIPQVVNSVVAIVNSIPAKLDHLYSLINNFVNEETTYSNFIINTYSKMEQTINGWISNASTILTALVEGLGIQILNSVIFFKNMFIGIIVAVYFLISRRKFARQGKMILYSIVNTKWADAIMNEIKFADSMFVGFINGKLLDSAIIGVICYICCLVFKFPNAMLVSVIIGVTNIIPFFGPFIGAIPSAILILIVSPIKALWFLLFIVVLQQIDGNIIGPKILGESTGVSSVWVLISILVFGGLWGFIGMIIGVPLFAVIYDITRRLVVYGLKKKDCLYLAYLSDDIKIDDKTKKGKS